MAVNYQFQDLFLNAFFTGRFGKDFYLTGGTALARFYFQHRESLDLDLFTQNQSIDFSQVNLEVLQIVDKLKLKIINQVVTGTFLQYITENSDNETLKIDLVKDIPIHFGENKIEGNIEVDSLENIGVNKVLAIFGRTDHKDFIDLFYILNNTNFSLQHFMDLAKKKDLGFTEFYFANSLQNIETAKTLPVLLKPLDLNIYMKFYQNASAQLFTNIKPTE